MPKSMQDYADEVVQAQVEVIDMKLEEINARLRKVDPLITLRDRLSASRRALLSQRAATANGGGKGLSQEELVNYMQQHSDDYFTVSQLAVALSATEGAVRGHLNRGKDERFTVDTIDGVKQWILRDPENEEVGEDDE